MDLDVPVISIGRGSENQIVLKDQSSSRRHCRVSTTPQGVVLEDLDSANGTLLNGEAVTRSFLEEGDEFRVGSAVITFQLRSVPSPGEMGPGETGESTESRSSTPGSREPATTPAPSPRTEAPSSAKTVASGEAPAPGGATLRCIDGPLKDRSFSLEPGPFVMGRHPSCNLPLKDQKVSSRHARIVREGADLVVEDLGSKNGVWVDGRKVSRRILVSGSEVVIGRFVFVATVPGTRPRGRQSPGTRSGVVPRTATIPGAAASDDQVLSRVDVDRLFAEERVRQPLIAVGLAVVAGLLIWFSVDIASRLLIERDVDPRPRESLVTRNWSFEEDPSPGAPPDSVPGWHLREGDGGRLERTRDRAQYPGAYALRLTAPGDDGLCAAQPEDDASLGVGREYVLEGFVASEGAFLAGYVVDWLGRSSRGMQILGRSFSESAQGPAGIVHVLERLTAPPGSSHARVACMLVGPGQSAVFDRVALTQERDPASREEAVPGLQAEMRVVDARGDLVLRLERKGDLELSRGGRPVVTSLWASLAAGRDPLLAGPRMAAVALLEGDRGSRVLSTKVPDFEERRWATVDATLTESASEIVVHWRLVSAVAEDPDRLALYLHTRSADLDVLVQGKGGSRRLAVAEAKGSGLEEIVLIADDEPTSLVFSTPVNLESRAHPWASGVLLVIEGAARERDLRVSFAPGSRRERDAALALLVEAERLYDAGQEGRARATLERLSRAYPAQETEIDQARSLLEEWRAVAARRLEELTAAFEQLEHWPAPVVYETLLAGSRDWARRLEESEDGGRFGELTRQLEAFWNDLSQQRTAEAQRALLEAALEHYDDGRYGLAELYFRQLVDAPLPDDLRAQARDRLQRIARQRAARWNVLLEQ
ncbi:MAG: FHA domain-containing protein [Planctomycetota bacterium]|nr:FHA domain-containing protein [Planctomycetota bacterium]